MNGGYLITPHIGYGVADENGNMIETFSYDAGEPIMSKETSETMKIWKTWLQKVLAIKRL